MIDIAHMPIDKWGLTSVGDELGANEARVWMASLDQPADMIAKLTPLLSQDERQRAMRYYRPVDRDRFIVVRGILRKIMSAYLALPPGQVRFNYNEYGKPAVSDDQNNRALNFNLSHSAELILYAVTRGRDVGIDIEYIREDFATLEIAEHFFSKDEVAALKSLPTDQRAMGFFNCWSRKEAFIKAKGMGVSYPLDRFTVSLAPGEPPALLKVDDDERECPFTDKLARHVMLPIPLCHFMLPPDPSVWAVGNPLSLLYFQPNSLRAWSTTATACSLLPMFLGLGRLAETRLTEGKIP